MKENKNKNDYLLFDNLLKAQQEFSCSNVEM